MEKRQILGIAGCVVLLIGGFAPLLSAPGERSLYVYELPFFYTGTYLALILGSAYLLWKKDYKPLVLTAGLSLLPVFFCILNFMSTVGLVNFRVWGLLFKSLDYGWLMLLAGVAVLQVASGFRRQDGLRALIPRDLRGGAAAAPVPPPPPGIGQSAAVMPPPPVGGMPPPPPLKVQTPTPLLTVTPPGPVVRQPLGPPTCAHCQAPLSANAKFCRSCGRPVTQPEVAAPVGPICQKCQTPLSATAKFCRACGAPVTPPVAASPRNCPRCGMQLDPDEPFCSGCGQKITPG
ncbi:MAG: zinc ribbon domain-containing protein [Desulfobacca sp.]|nr:zinc ribbon domain-containing protein [Desulfobacca sp.]